jgi:putative MATE family efflux protein
LITKVINNIRFAARTSLLIFIDEYVKIMLEKIYTYIKVMKSTVKLSFCSVFLLQKFERGKTMFKSPFYKNLLKIAFPIMIQYFITSSLNLMDNFMIGRLGEEAVAALGIANQYFFLLNIIIMGIYSGCNVLIAQFWGKKDLMSIRKVLGISLVLGVAVSVGFTFFGRFFSEEVITIFNKNNEVINLGKNYLELVCISYVFMAISLAFGIGSRGIQKAFLPMICSACALVLNVFFNYVFIFGHFNMPAMGVRGAALATLIARVCEMILILFLIYRKDHVLKASASEMLAFNVEFFKDIMKVTVPVIINELCWGLGMVIYSVIYGNMGTKAIAAVQICMTVQNMFFIVLFAVSNAACVMVGNEIGKDDFETAKDYAKKLIKICLVLSLVMGLALATSSKFILNFYKISHEVYTSALYMLLITAFILPVRFMNVLLIVGVLRGGGDTSYVLKIELATMWLVGVPICMIGAFILKIPVYEVFFFVTIEEVVKCILSIKRYRSKKWMKNLVQNMNTV